VDISKLLSEVEYKAIKSSGSGGQHVNKVATKIELCFNLKTTEAFTDEELAILNGKLLSKLSKSGFLIMTSSETRSQYRNKALVTKRFLELIKESVKILKERKPTKTPNSVKRKRLDDKKKISEKKASRKPPKID